MNSQPALVPDKKPGPSKLLLAILALDILIGAVVCGDKYNVLVYFWYKIL